MNQMTLTKIAQACGGTLYAGAATGTDPASSGSSADLSITGVVIDSRLVEPGNLYVAMRGERVDGHTFIPDVFEKGAAAVVSEEVLDQPAGPYILVDSCPQALKDIAEYYRSTLTIPIIGIAGSVGKTSTKEMIASVLSEKYHVLKTEGNFNNEIGLPLTLLRIRDSHEAAVVEMGISDFGEMHRLAKIAKPDICVMTNIGQCHLENLIDRDGVLRAKSEIFDYLKEDGVIVLNGNDDKLSGVGSVPAPGWSGDKTEAHTVPPVRYFVEDGTAARGSASYFVIADHIENHGLKGMTAVLHFPDADCPVTEPIPGLHNIYNACAGACVGHALGLTYAEICAGIAHAKTIAGRTNLIEAGDILIIDDCYNANPVSMRASLDVLSLAEGRKIAVLGDMGELGENERALHREVGAYAAEKHIDILCCTGELSQELAAAASSGCEAVHKKDREELTAYLLGIVKPGDTILVKASHFMQYPAIVKKLKDTFGGK